MKTLKQFINAHEGETAYVFGKGPSLDDCDVESAGPLRMAINDAIRAVPDVPYCFANDPVRDYVDLYQPGQTLFVPSGKRHGKDRLFDDVSPVCEVVRFDDEYRRNDFIPRDPEELAESLTVIPGTLGSLVQIAYVMGVKKIVAIGIDGGGKRANFNWIGKLRNDVARDYNQIRDYFINTCSNLKIELEFFRGNQPVQTHEQPNGTMRIEIIRNTFVRGIAYEAGETADISPSDAAMLIHCGKAIPVSRTVAATETAEAKPVIETPEKPVVKTAKKKAASK